MARKPMTDEQKAAWAEKMKAARAKKSEEKAPEPQKVVNDQPIAGNTDLALGDIDAQIEMLQRLKAEKSQVDDNDFAGRLKIRYPQLNFYYDEKDYQFQNARGEQTTVRRFRITVTREVEHVERDRQGNETVSNVEIIIGQNSFTERDFKRFDRFVAEIVTPPKKVEAAKIPTVQGRRVFSTGQLNGMTQNGGFSDSKPVDGWKEEGSSVETMTVPMNRG